MHRILTSSYYIGKVTHGGVKYDGRHPPLIDNDTWNAVRAILSGRRLAGDRTWKNDHYLLGSLRCGVCHSRIGYTLSTGRNGERYPYFFCLGRAKKRTTCTLPFGSVDEVERKVAQHWSSVALTPEMITQVRATVTEELRSAMTTAETVSRQ